MKLLQSIQHLRRKLTRKKFYVEDKDTEALNTIIAFYNESEKGFQLNFRNYQLLIVLILKYEIANMRANQLFDKLNGITPKKSLNILDVRKRVIEVITTYPNEKHIAELILESGTQKFANKLITKGIDIDEMKIEDIANDEGLLKAMLFTELNEKKLMQIVNDMTNAIIMNESAKNRL